MLACMSHTTWEINAIELFGGIKNTPPFTPPKKNVFAIILIDFVLSCICVFGVCVGKTEVGVSSFKWTGDC